MGNVAYDVRVGTLTCDVSTLANIDTNLGFVPSAVMLFNRTTNTQIWWNSNMTAGTAIVKGLQATGLTPARTIAMHSSNKKNVNITAYSIWENGIYKSQAIQELQCTNAKTIDKSKWGCFGFSVPIAGTAIAGTDTPTFAYATEAESIAALPACASKYYRVGYFTLKSNSAASFVTGTNTLDQADNVNYYSGPVLEYVSTAGITALTGSSTITISAGTTMAGTIGFRVGTDDRIQTLSATIDYWAWR